MTAAEKVQAMRLLETGQAELAAPMTGAAVAMKQSLVDAAEIAVELKRIIEENGLSKVLKPGAKPYVFSDGWLTASRIQNESTYSKVLETVFDDATGESVTHAEGWLEDMSGRVVARADAYVSTGEKQWSDKPFYARASMAQTRAVAKAMRIRHAWIMVMAGYQATPAEEMEGVEIPEPEQAPKPPPKRTPAQVIPPAEKLTTRKVKPEESKIHPPVDPQAPGDPELELVYIKGFGQADAKGRMGVRCIFQDQTEDWANLWSSTDQALMKDKVLEAKRGAQDQRSAGASFYAKVKRTPRKEGDGNWVDLSDLVEVTHGV